MSEDMHGCEKMASSPNVLAAYPGNVKGLYCNLQ